jgi:hypothetical protein
MDIREIHIVKGRKMVPRGGGGGNSPVDPDKYYMSIIALDEEENGNVFRRIVTKEYKPETTDTIFDHANNIITAIKEKKK